MYCPFCGTEANNDDIFCRNCGRVFKNTQNAGEELKMNEEPDTDMPTSANSRKKSRSTQKSADGFTMAIAIFTLIAIVVSGGLIVYKRISGKSVSEDIRQAVSNISSKHTTHSDDSFIQIKETTEKSTTANPTTTVAATATTTTTTTTKTTTPATEDDFPKELSKYRGKMVKEGKNYKVTLQEKDWNIIFRSEPKITKSSDKNDNRICKISDGTVINVEYIYDNTWAVFKYNGQWGFASLYADADRSKRPLMLPV